MGQWRRTQSGSRAAVLASVIVAAAAALPASAMAAITVHAAAITGAGTIEDAIVQGAHGQEWFVIKNGSSFVLEQASASGTLTSSSITSLPASLSDPNAIVALVSAKGYVWALGNSSHLYAINGSGSATPAAQSGIDSRDMTVGPDGNLWATDHTGNIIKYAITSSGTATTTKYPVHLVALDAITSAGGYLVWTDDRGYPWYTSPASPSSPGGPYTGTSISGYAHSIVAADGNLWAAGSIGRAQQGQIEKLSPSPPYSVNHAYPGPTASEITSLTVGPDGDLWFPEAGANAVGQFDPSTHAITQHPMPRGFALPPGINPFTPYAIATGPNNTIWFTARTSGGQSAIGEITGISAAAGTVSVAKTATVSRKGVVSVSVSCGGSSGAPCDGTLALFKGKTELGSTAYHLTAIRSTPVRLRLSRVGVRAVNRAKHHKLSATATLTPTGANRLAGRSITLVGPKRNVK
jgi:streptogramin lyase